MPFRPHRGVYVLVDEPDRSVDQDAALQRIHTDVLPTLAGVPGVAGAWSYATTPSIRRPMFSDGSLRIIVCYLDEDPATVGGRLSPVVDRLWSTSPSRLVLAAPFESWPWTWTASGPTPSEPDPSGPAQTGGAAPALRRTAKVRVAVATWRSSAPRSWTSTRTTALRCPRRSTWARATTGPTRAASR